MEHEGDQNLLLTFRVTICIEVSAETVELNLAIFALISAEVDLGIYL